MIVDSRHHLLFPVWTSRTGTTNGWEWQLWSNGLPSHSSIGSFLYQIRLQVSFLSNASIHFSESKPVGCLVHLKQTARRKINKIKELKFQDKEVSFAMRKGVFDLLIVIPKHHLLMGIEFFAGMIDKYIQNLHVKDSDIY